MNTLKLLLTTLFIISSSCVFSKRNAIVKNKKAIIYADGDLQNPIGYISKGKKIYIGNINYKSETVTAVAVSGKIAFIKTKDLIINSKIFKKQFKKQNQIDNLKTNNNYVDQKESIYNHFAIFSIQPIVSISSTLQAATSLNTDLSPLLFKLDVERHSSNSNFFWGAGFKYNQLKSSLLVYKTLILNLKTGYKLIQTNYFNLNLSMGLNYSADYRLEFSDATRYKGSLYGSNIEMFIHFFPNSSWSIRSGFGINFNKVTNLENVPIPNSTNLITESSYNNSYLFLGLSKSL